MHDFILAALVLADHGVVLRGAQTDAVVVGGDEQLGAVAVLVGLLVLILHSSRAPALPSIVRRSLSLSLWWMEVRLTGGGRRVLLVVAEAAGIVLQATSTIAKRRHFAVRNNSKFLNTAFVK